MVARSGDQKRPRRRPGSRSRRGHAIGRLSGLLLRRYIDPLCVLDLARLFNAARCQPPLNDDDVARIVAAITDREKQRRERMP
jgi:hypothetical protein